MANFGMINHHVIFRAKISFCSLFVYKCLVVTFFTSKPAGRPPWSHPQSCRHLLLDSPSPTVLQRCLAGSCPIDQFIGSFLSFFVGQPYVEMDPNPANQHFRWVKMVCPFLSTSFFIGKPRKARKTDGSSSQSPPDSWQPKRLLLFRTRSPSSNVACLSTKDSS